jgi:hypothetical protein
MLSMSYAVYELVFPPGEPDELARTRAWAFAEKYGCTIKNQPSEKRVLFLIPEAMPGQRAIAELARLGTRLECDNSLSITLVQKIRQANQIYAHNSAGVSASVELTFQVKQPMNAGQLLRGTR